MRAALDKVCSKLPKSLVNQCETLVNQYTQELVDMLVADFTPEEVCTYLKICKKPGQVTLVRDAEVSVSVIEPYEIRTNEVAAPESDEKSLAYTSVNLNLFNFIYLFFCFVFSGRKD